MTEFEFIIEDSNGTRVTQTLKNEKSIYDIDLQIEIDSYLNHYVLEWDKANKDNNIELARLELYYDNQIIREITKN